MNKVRVFELAKELGFSSKELMAKLQELGFAIASHMATLEEKETKLVIKKFGHLKPKKKVEAKKARPKKKKEEKEKEPSTPPKSKAKAKPKKKEVAKEKPVEEEGPRELAGPTLEKKSKAPVKETPTEESLPAAAATEVVEPPAPKVAEPVEPAPPKPAPPRAEVPRAEAPKSEIRKVERPPEKKSGAPEPKQAERRPKGPSLRKRDDDFRDRPVRRPEKPEKIEELEVGDETDLLLEEKKRIEQRERQRTRKKRKRQRAKEREARLEQQKVIEPPPPSERLLRRKARGPRRPLITVDEVMTVDELARNLKIKASALIRELMQQDIMVTKNEPLELEMVERIAEKYGYDVQVATSPEDLLEEYVEDAPENLKLRAPVVTVMGHVDHGKTALLDAIRSTNVMAGEAGGITQHIGAYTVKLDSGRVVFLDTPGHEAFTSMRAHGAQVTDVVVLVVAADDGIMPQTVEAVNHARAAEVPIVVAINKIDKPSANIDRVKQQLAELDLLPEDWGGKTITVSVSAKTKEGIPALLEMLLLESELLELMANPDRAAQGVVLEAKLDRGRGPVATVLVQNGTLRVGDAFIVGTQFGRVRALLSDQGEPLTEAGPATPVEVLGFTGVPQASDVFVTVNDEKKARQIADSRALKVRQKEMLRRKRITLEDLYEQIQAGEVRELNLVIKGDVQGSVVALQDALLKLPTENVKLNVIHAGVGGIKESDVILALASNALLIGFNVRPDANARELATREGVDYRLYRVIYDLIDDVRAAMEGLLEPEKKEIFLGRAEILQVFRVSEVGIVAGCRVHEGEITVEGRVRVVRDGVIVHDGKMSSLKRYKDFARSAPAGTECGIGLANFNDEKVGDMIECYRIEEIARTL